MGIDLVFPMCVPLYGGTRAWKKCGFLGFLQTIYGVDIVLLWCSAKSEIYKATGKKRKCEVIGFHKTKSVVWNMLCN